MNQKKWILPIWVTVVLLGLAPSQVLMASEDPGFYMSSEQSGETVTVTIHAREARDLYAYDFVLEAKADRLELLQANSILAGFTVGPLFEGNSMQFAYTKVGAGKGADGDVKLARFHYKLEGGHSAIISLKKVQYVDSLLYMREYYPELELKVGVLALWSDIVGHWAESIIGRAAERSLVSGYGDRSFRPDQPLTRGEFAALLVRMMGLPTKSDESRPDFVDSYDIPAWAAPYVAAAHEMGIMQGYDDGSFRAKQPVTREETAVIASRVRKMWNERGGMDSVGDLEQRFTDYAQISEWARKDVAWAAVEGLMTGRGNGRFAPRQMTTRAEAVVLLLRLDNSKFQGT